VHRFFQMWQQLDCDITQATSHNPSGCQSDLFPWVAVAVGIGSNGQPQPPDFNEQSTSEGAVAMGFYNSFEGDGSYFTQLAHQYALSDNHHQAIMGGTGANHLAIGFGTTLFYEDANGPPASEPDREPEPTTEHQQFLYPGRLQRRVLRQLCGCVATRRRVDHELSRLAALSPIQ
jgi:phospholipase C